MSQNLPQNVVPNDCLVVPVPTATGRRRERGFDHAALLARYIARQLKLEFVSALARLGQSRQVGAGRSQRLKQSELNYRVARPSLIAERHILLVDDVITTGATIQAATRTLKQARAKSVNALAFVKKL